MMAVYLTVVPIVLLTVASTLAIPGPSNNWEWKYCSKYQWWQCVLMLLYMYTTYR